MIKRTLGAVLTAAGVLGVVLSVGGIVFVWLAADSVKTTADAGLDLFLEALQTVERSLDAASTTMDRSVVAAEGLYTTTVTLQGTLDSTRTTLDSTASLAGENLPQSIESTLVALEVTEEAAGRVDRTLRALSRFGLTEYDPDVPLDQAISGVREELKPVPEELRGVGDGLHRVDSDLGKVQSSVAVMADHILGIRDQVDNISAIVGDQAGVVRGLDEWAGALRENLRRPLRLLTWGATLLLGWMGLSQLALVHWGISFWRGDGLPGERPWRPRRAE